MSIFYSFILPPFYRHYITPKTATPATPPTTHLAAVAIAPEPELVELADAVETAVSTFDNLCAPAVTVTGT